MITAHSRRRFVADPELSAMCAVKRLNLKT
jgi:hypothetical protein